MRTVEELGQRAGHREDCSFRGWNLHMPTSPNVAQEFAVQSNIGALIIPYTILGAPYYNYSIMGPKTLF